MKEFLKRKDIILSPKRYFIDALSAMAQGLFASLIIGLIIRTLGEQLTRFFSENFFFSFLTEAGTLAISLMGPAIGAAVSFGLKAPMLVVVCGAVTGAAGASFGGPAGAFVGAVFGCEFGKAVSKETRLDIIVTPAVTILIGTAAAKLIGPAISQMMNGIGQIVISSTNMQPFFFGIINAVIVGLVLTAPISSAALALMLGLDGLAGGAATAGCCAQMIGFAVISYKDNGFGGSLAQGIGTSMLQVPNIIKNPWIVVPPTLASAVTGPLSTLVFNMNSS